MNATAPADAPTRAWPDRPTEHPLGDGRFAESAERPGSVDELREAVARRASSGLAIYPQGGTTALDYGGVPRLPGVAFDLLQINRVIDYPVADMTITIEAGMTLAALRATTGEHRQRLELDAPQPDRATIGGIYATNTNGPRRLVHGRPRDQIIGISFVASDGKLLKGGGRVVKNVAGYDFPKLLTGSLGTLSIITQLTLKVRPSPEAAAIIWAGYPDAISADAALARIDKSAARPVAIELLNAPAARQVGLAEHPWGIAIGLEDNAASVAWQIDRLRTDLAGSAGFEVVEGVAADPIWSALTDFQAAKLGPITFVAQVRPSTIIKLVGSLDPGRWAIEAHAGSGVVRGHALGTDTDPAAEISRLRAIATQAGGALSLSRCPTDRKGELKVWGEPRPDWAVAERVKRALDPAGLMNPGRFVGTI